MVPSAPRTTPSGSMFSQLPEQPDGVVDQFGIDNPAAVSVANETLKLLLPSKLMNGLPVAVRSCGPLGEYPAPFVHPPLGQYPSL
jgi:hypothetical protein